MAALVERFERLRRESDEFTHSARDAAAYAREIERREDAARSVEMEIESGEGDGANRLRPGYSDLPSSAAAAEISKEELQALLRCLHASTRILRNEALLVSKLTNARKGAEPCLHGAAAPPSAEAELDQSMRVTDVRSFQREERIAAVIGRTHREALVVWKTEPSASAQDILAAKDSEPPFLSMIRNFEKTIEQRDGYVVSLESEKAGLLEELDLKNQLIRELSERLIADETGLADGTPLGGTLAAVEKSDQKGRAAEDKETMTDVTAAALMLTKVGSDIQVIRNETATQTDIDREPEGSISEANLLKRKVINLECAVNDLLAQRTRLVEERSALEEQIAAYREAEKATGEAQGHGAEGRDGEHRRYATYERTIADLRKELDEVREDNENREADLRDALADLRDAHQQQDDQLERFRTAHKLKVRLVDSLIERLRLVEQEAADAEQDLAAEKLATQQLRGRLEALQAEGTTFLEQRNAELEQSAAAIVALRAAVSCLARRRGVRLDWSFRGRRLT